MATARTATSTRWAGVPADRRRDERRAMLVRAAFLLFGEEGEAALTVRAVCREAELHTRYFYENFAGTGDLLAAVYDREATALGEDLARALDERAPGPTSAPAPASAASCVSSATTRAGDASCSPRRAATKCSPNGGGPRRPRCSTACSR